jgi:hypothetical protein
MAANPYIIKKELVIDTTKGRKKESPNNSNIAKHGNLVVLLYR